MVSNIWLLIDKEDFWSMSILNILYDNDDSKELFSKYSIRIQHLPLYVCLRITKMMNETIEKYKKHNSTKEFQKDLDRIIHAMQERAKACVQKVSNENVEEFDKSAMICIRHTLLGLSLYIKSKFEPTEENIENTWKSTLKFKFNTETENVEVCVDDLKVYFNYAYTCETNMLMTTIKTWNVYEELTRLSGHPKGIFFATGAAGTGKTETMKDYARYFAGKHQVCYCCTDDSDYTTKRKKEMYKTWMSMLEAAALSNHCFILEESNRHTMEATSQFLNLYAKKNENGTFIIPPMACWFTGNILHDFEEYTKLCDKKMIKYAQVTFARPSPEVVLSIFLGGLGIEPSEVSPVILKYFEVACESISEKHKFYFSYLFRQRFGIRAAKVFSHMLKKSSSHGFEALAKIIGKMDCRDMAPFDGFPEAAILGNRRVIDSLLRGSRRRHFSGLDHNWLAKNNEVYVPMEQLYVEDIVLLLRKCNLAEVAVKLLEKEVYKEAYHSDHVIVSNISNIKRCGDLLPAILRLNDKELRDKCLALPVIKSLVQWKWNALYKILALEFVAYISLMALYTAWVSYLPIGNSISKGLVYSMLCIMVPFITIEFAQKRPRATALIGKFQWKEILMDGTTSALIVSTIIPSLYENSDLSVPYRVAVACTMLLLSWRVVTAYLSSLSSFAFMMLMMQSVVIYIFPFMILLLVIMYAFSVIFYIFTEASTESSVINGNSITGRAWDVYKLAIMGDFGDEIEVSVYMQVSFIVITMIINIIMLNILISLVCEGFSDALQRKDKEFNIQRTAKVIELEATYLSGKDRTLQFGLAEPVTFHDTAWPNWLLPSLPPSTGREGKEMVDEPLIVSLTI